MGVSQFTHRHPLPAGGRQLFLGLAAAAVTYVVGAVIGASGI